MGTKEAYRQKIEAEIELAQAKLAELKQKPRVLQPIPVSNMTNK
jgi:hypothetical protein